MALPRQLIQVINPLSQPLKRLFQSQHNGAFYITAEFTHPLAPTAAAEVPCDQDNPTVPSIGLQKRSYRHLRAG